MLHKLTHLQPKPGLDGSFSSYHTRSRYPQESQALHLLRRCAYIVSPLMRRYGWTIPFLSELSPSSSCHGKNYIVKEYTRNRFGLSTSTNVSLKIELCLRDVDNPTRFLPTHCLIQTLLHELAHLRHGAHFFAFYGFNAMLLDELVEDVGRGELRRTVAMKEVPDCVERRKDMLRTMRHEVESKAARWFGLQRKKNRRRA
ncbi:hypothetical protein BDW02DRAFT_504534 [Decorospora gaudefroyi]|uniref:WLM domain-containing protein n=1 Tax=Decorospora gaudefroyi TaxID=184978 RepID=A0A6A5K4U5_9PLEO|nr:hypothetical protein BDW02DRAFT_504534 [Decorospora gaudefroyi]